MPYVFTIHVTCSKMDGYNVIFIVTPNLINESIKVAAKYPNVYMFNCQLGSSHNKVRSYLFEYKRQ